MTPADIVKTVREFGPVWGVGIVLATLASLIGRLRWGAGGESVGALLRDPVFLAASLGAVALFAAWVPSYHLLIGRRRGLPEPFARDQIGILVASVPGDTERRTQQTYAQSIRALLASEGVAEARVRLIERPLPNDPDRQHAEAVKLGKRLRASFVLRAIPIEAGHQVWVDNVDLPDFDREEAHLGKLTDRQLAEIETLALPSQVGLLARCALALSHHRGGRYREAALILRALADAGELPVGLPHRPHLMFLLGNCLVNDRFHDPASVLPAAVAAFDAALRLWTREAHPTPWADAMTNRGLACSLLPGPVQRDNLAEAERCFALAHAVHTRDADPERWARIALLRARAQLTAATPGPDGCIRALDAAAEVFTRRKHPYEWAYTMLAKGLALGRLESLQGFRESLKCFALAGEVLTRDRYPYDWGVLAVARAAAYIGDPFLSNAEDLGDEGLEDAIAALDSVEEVLPRDRYPVEWVGAKTASALFAFLTHTADAEMGEQSLRWFDEALEVADPDRYPVQCASIHAARAVACSVIKGDDPAGRLREAARSARTAAELYERQGMPDEARSGRTVLAGIEGELAAEVGPDTTTSR